MCVNNGVVLYILYIYCVFMYFMCSKRGGVDGAKDLLNVKVLFVAVGLLLFLM